MMDGNLVRMRQYQNALDEDLRDNRLRKRIPEDYLIRMEEKVTITTAFLFRDVRLMLACLLFLNVVDSLVTRIILFFCRMRDQRLMLMKQPVSRAAGNVQRKKQAQGNGLESFPYSAVFNYCFEHQHALFTTPAREFTAGNPALQHCCIICRMGFGAADEGNEQNDPSTGITRYTQINNRPRKPS